MLAFTMLVKRTPKRGCAHCQAGECHANEQADFDCLQVHQADAHDTRLVEARMLGLPGLRECRNDSVKWRDVQKSVKQNGKSDYWLKRVMAGVDKICTFLRRRPRAKTSMQACAQYALVGAAESQMRSSTY
jgi:hypothetical protein